MGLNADNNKTQMLIIEENAIIALDILLGLRKNGHNVIFVRNTDTFNISKAMEGSEPKIIITSLNVLEKQFVKNRIYLADDINTGNLMAEVKGLKGPYTFVYSIDIMKKFSKPYFTSDLIGYINNTIAKKMVSNG